MWCVTMEDIFNSDIQQTHKSFQHLPSPTVNSPSILVFFLSRILKSELNTLLTGGFLQKLTPVAVTRLQSKMC